MNCTCSSLKTRAFFSGETALYLHELMEREPICTTVTVKRSYNAAHFHNFAQIYNLGEIQVHTVSDKLFEPGVCEVETNYGNTVRVYYMDRTICEIINKKTRWIFRFSSMLSKNISKVRKKTFKISPNMQRCSKLRKRSGHMQRCFYDRSSYAIKRILYR